MLFGIEPFCLDHLVFGILIGLIFLLLLSCAADVALWPYTPGLLVKWVTFLGSLHWPAGGLDLGVGGISYVELLILYELWAGERLSLEKATPRYLGQGVQFQCRLFLLVQALIFGAHAVSLGL